MPVMRPYESQVQAQGFVNSEASPNDFGAQVGGALQQFGGAVSEAGETLHKLEVQRDTTRVHTEFAKARYEWTKNLQERVNAAQPGDETFAPTLVKDLTEWGAKGAESTTTRQGRQLWESMAANMTSEFGQRAVTIQGELAAREAANQHNVLTQSLGSAVFNDATQYKSALDSARAAITDPNSIYAKVPTHARDKFLQDIEQELSLSMINGIVQRDPEFVLNSVAPAELEQFKPWQSLIDANVAPGGTTNLKPEVVAKSKDFVEAASDKGVIPNILMAQAGANPPEFNQTPNEMATTMGALLNGFGGDYTKALAAYHFGAKNLNETMQTWGNTWADHLPFDTAQYVNRVLLDSGMEANPNAAPASEPAATTEQRVAVKSGLPGFEKLTWQQQERVVKDSVQLQMARRSMALQARQEQEYLKQEKQETILNGMLQQIVDPKQFGRLKADTILKDPTLEWKQKQHMIDYMAARSRELNAGYENRTNRTEFNRLFFMIHAADDDPTKTYNLDPVMESFKQGRISTNEMFRLRTEVEQLKQNGGNSFQKEVARVSAVARDMFTKNVEWMGPQMAGEAVEGWHRFHTDMEAKIAAKRKENKDPSILFDPNSSEYLLKKERLAAFLPSTQTLATKAAKAKAGGASFVPKGVIENGYRSKGGDRYDPKTWEKI